MKKNHSQFAIKFPKTDKKKFQTFFKKKIKIIDVCKFIENGNRFF